MQVVKVKVDSTKEMIALGKKLGESITTPVVVDIKGEMGSGKTHLVKGLALGLGVSAEITSPTFSIIDYYADGRLPFYHIDAYRLDSIAEGYEIGFEELFSEEAVVAIEWSDLFRELFENQVIEVEIIYISDQSREVIIKGIEVF